MADTRAPNTKETFVEISGGKIITFRRGQNSTSLHLKIHNPQKIVNLNAPSECKGLIYNNPAKTNAIYSFKIAKGAVIQISFLKRVHSQVLCYKGRNLVELLRHNTWARKKYSYQTRG